MRLTRASDVLIYKMMKKEIEEALWKSQDERIKEEYYSFSLGENIKYEDLRRIIRSFATIFQKNFTEEETYHMYYKLKFLRMRESQIRQIVGKYISLGNYNSTTNVITIVQLSHPKITKRLQEETFYHELLHMASTVRTKDHYYVGFEIPGVLGRKLNEGYTEYLTRKYFTRGNEYVQTNDIGVIFAKGIENIIGEKKMQEFYFKGNINGLIEELSKTSSREDVIKLLFAMDRLDSKFKESEDKENIIKEITKMNKRKIEMDYEDGILSDEEYQIERIIKVDHYRVRNLWSEQTRIVDAGDSFYLEDQGFKSRLYEKRYVNKEKIKCKQ